tara:strand:- start:28190 stop:28291 length:102 start_codon:yes stop_codon:yes gene_type:complete
MTGLAFLSSLFFPFLTTSQFDRKVIFDNTGITN